MCRCDYPNCCGEPSGINSGSTNSHRWFGREADAFQAKLTAADSQFCCIYSILWATETELLNICSLRFTSSTDFSLCMCGFFSCFLPQSRKMLRRLIGISNCPWVCERVVVWPCNRLVTCSVDQQLLGCSSSPVTPNGIQWVQDMDRMNPLDVWWQHSSW